MVHTRRKIEREKELRMEVSIVLLFDTLSTLIVFASVRFRNFAHVAPIQFLDRLNRTLRKPSFSRFYLILIFLKLILQTMGRICYT